LRGQTIKGAGFDFPLKENLTDCVNDSEQQGEGIEEDEVGEDEYEYSLLGSPKIIIDIVGAIKIG
jgi:hypothetical protein